MKDLSISMQLPKSVDNAIGNLTDKPTMEVGTTIGDLWFLVFGNFSQKANKRRLNYQYGLKEYEHILKTKLDAIQKENLIDPNTRIVTQVLEDSKCCAEEKEIREMFASLIASASDKTKVDFVHPNFSNIIKQMSSLDACTFKYVLQESRLIDTFSGESWLLNGVNFLEFFIKQDENKDENKYTLKHRMVILGRNNTVLNYVNADAIATLTALGLLRLEYLNAMNNETVESFKEIIRESISVADFEKIGEANQGNINVTQVGQNFAIACGLKKQML